MEDFKDFTPYETPEEGLEEYLENFIKSRREDLEEINMFFKNDEEENVKKILHKWEGFSEPYGFGGLRKFSTQIRACLTLQKKELFEKIYIQIKSYLDYKEKQLL